MSTCTSRFALLIAGLAVVAVPGIAQATQESRRGMIPRAELTQVLDCLTRSGQRLGLDPSFVDDRAFKVRYYYGVRDPNVDRENELHLIVYGRDGESALLYELLVTRRSDCLQFEFINTASLKPSKGHWLVTETLGGVYSYKRAQQLVDFVSRTAPIEIPRTEVVKSCAVCSYR